MRQEIPASFHQWAEFYGYALYPYARGHIELSRICTDAETDEEYATVIRNASSLREAVETMIQDRLVSLTTRKARTWDMERMARQSALESSRMMARLVAQGGDLTILDGQDGLCGAWDYEIAS